MSEQNTEKITWLTKDNEEIDLKDMNEDHILRAFHRSMKQKERWEKELKKAQDLSEFWDKMSSEIYQELKRRHISLKVLTEDHRKNIAK